MPKNRTYRLLCPIARALDRVGDRWTLLILRDLHAGPARFTDLQTGLTGLASNLLSTRLEQLQTDGLIVRQERGRSAAYELTAAGARTAPLLFELSQFGSAYPAPDEVRRPGNLRTIVVTLREALRRLGANADLHVELAIDDEFFGIDLRETPPQVRYGAEPDAPIRVATSYEPLMALADGTLAPEAFLAEHFELERGEVAEGMQFFGILGQAFAG